MQILDFGRLMVVYDGTAIIPATHEYRFESPFNFVGTSFKG